MTTEKDQRGLMLLAFNRGRRPQAKEHEWPLEAKRRQETHTPLDSPERNVVLPKP